MQGTLINNTKTYSYVQKYTQKAEVDGMYDLLYLSGVPV